MPGRTADRLSHGTWTESRAKDYQYQDTNRQLKPFSFHGPFSLLTVGIRLILYFYYILESNCCQSAIAETRLSGRGFASILFYERLPCRGNNLRKLGGTKPVRPDGFFCYLTVIQMIYPIYIINRNIPFLLVSRLLKKRKVNSTSTVPIRITTDSIRSLVPTGIISCEVK